MNSRSNGAVLALAGVLCSGVTGCSALLGLRPAAQEATTVVSTTTATVQVTTTVVVTQPAPATSSAVPAGYPADAVAFGGHHYRLYDDVAGATWSQAGAVCAATGGYLAVISSAAENGFLANYVQRLDARLAYFGLSDEVVEGSFVWGPGEVSTYVNWHRGEPNGEKDHEDYALFNWSSVDGRWVTDGTWNDADFQFSATKDSPPKFLCEWPS